MADLEQPAAGSTGPSIPLASRATLHQAEGLARRRCRPHADLPFWQQEAGEVQDLRRAEGGVPQVCADIAIATSSTRPGQAQGDPPRRSTAQDNFPEDATHLEEGAESDSAALMQKTRPTILKKKKQAKNQFKDAPWRQKKE